MKATRTSTVGIVAVLVVCLGGVSSGETITLQPDGDAGKDVSVVNYFGFLYYAINYSVGTVYGVDPGLYNAVSFIEFDLASIDPSVTVTAAELGIYAYEVAVTEDHSLYEVTEPWVEPPFSATGDPTAEWGQFPATKSDAEDSVTATAGTSDWLRWDVTSLVSSWIDGSSANHGVVIASDAGAVLFWASEHETQPALRPYLQIDYVPEPTTLVLLATGALGIACRRRRAKKG